MATATSSSPSEEEKEREAMLAIRSGGGFGKKKGREGKSGHFGGEWKEMMMTGRRRAAEEELSLSLCAAAEIANNIGIPSVRPSADAGGLFGFDDSSDIDRTHTAGSSCLLRFSGLSLSLFLLDGNSFR